MTSELPHRFTNGLFGLRYTLDSDLLAQKVFNEVREKPVEFCKSFYNATEMDFFHRNRFSSASSPVSTGYGGDIKANCVIKLPPERMCVMNTAGAAFQVPVPSSPHADGAVRSVNVRLISPFRTPDMVGACPCAISWPGYERLDA